MRTVVFVSVPRLRTARKSCVPTNASAARESSSTGAEELALFNALLIYTDSAAAFMAQ